MTQTPANMRERFMNELARCPTCGADCHDWYVNDDYSKRYDCGARLSISDDFSSFVVLQGCPRDLRKRMHELVEKIQEQGK